MSIRYQEFIIQFDPTEDPDGYRVRVTGSPLGEGLGYFRVPKSLRADSDLLDSNSPPRILGESTGAVDRKATAEGPFARRDRSKEQGKALYEALFVDQVGALFDGSLASVASVPDLGLRIQFKFTSEEAYLSQLPWELLYRPDLGDFLALDPKTPIVRYLEVPRPVPSQPFSTPLRILAVLSSPTDMAALNVEEERRQIEKATDWPEVSVRFIERATTGDLRQELLSQRSHILHFVGHGGFDSETNRGSLFFEDEDGNSVPVSARDLTAALKGLDSLQLVFLNACETGLADSSADRRFFEGLSTRLVLDGTPAVISMQSEIKDRSAIQFSSRVYERLVKGDLTEKAVTEGRIHLAREKATKEQWSIPVLYTRFHDKPLLDIVSIKSKLTTLWSAVGSIVLLISTNAVLRVQEAKIRLLWPDFGDVVPSDAAAVYGMILGGLPLLLLLYLTFQYRKRFGGSGLASGLPIAYGAGIQPEIPSDRWYQYFFFFFFLVAPMAAQIHFARVAFRTSVYCRECEETFFSKRLSHFSTEGWEKFFSNDYRFGDVNGPTFLPFWEPWFLLLLEATLLFGFIIVVIRLFLRKK